MCLNHKNRLNLTQKGLKTQAKDKKNEKNEKKVKKF